ncbi:MAG: type I methionyl aminopeptidase [Candidatus Omnitrophota bacterium]|nr:type I methionyl aminopeptidase [Candidatus Omnitrophota bacterium]
MITLKSKREIELMTRAGAVLKQVFENVKPAVTVGVTTRDLDKIAEETILNAGAEIAFKGYRGFPATCCISVNEEVVHGIPSDRKLCEGDLVSVDVGASVEGYFSDAARTWPVGKIDKQRKHLMDTARDSLKAGLSAYKPGCRIGDLSAAIEQLIKSRGFEVVREYVGHGIGKKIHEDPQVPNYGKSGYGPRIEPGLVLAIEPMVTEGHYAVETLKDGWTVVTKDRKWASHHEETIVFTEKGFICLTGEIS